MKRTFNGVAQNDRGSGTHCTVDALLNSEIIDRVSADQSRHFDQRSVCTRHKLDESTTMAEYCNSNTTASDARATDKCFKPRVITIVVMAGGRIRSYGLVLVYNLLDLTIQLERFKV